MSNQNDFLVDPNRFMIDDILDLVKVRRKHLKKKKKKKDGKGNSGVIKNNTSNFYLKSREINHKP